MSSNSGPGHSHHGGAPENALSWSWGIVGSRGALGSEALEVGGVAVQLKTDSAKSRHGSQP